MKLRSVAYLSLADVARALNGRYLARRIAGGASALPEEKGALLQRMRADNRAAPAPFRATALWLEVARLFDREFYMTGLSEVEAKYYNVRFFGYAPRDPRLYDYLLHTYYLLVLQRDTLNLLDRIPASAPLGPGQSLVLDGRRISLDLLLSVDDFYNLVDIRPEVATDAIAVADIGAGWGRLGYVLKKANPRATYIVFDLPETLLVSSTYLSSLLPEFRCPSYGTTRDTSLDRKALHDGGLWFLPAQDLARVADGALDLVVNVASFQEMTLAQVDAYFDLIDRTARGGGLYLRQLWSGSTHGHNLNEIGGFDEYPFRSRWRELYRRTTRFSHLFFETGHAL